MSPLDEGQPDDLERFKQEVVGLRRNRQAGRKSPHKLVLVLAVLDLFEDGVCTNNEIQFDEGLQERFQKRFSQYSRSADWSQLAPPFFHLRTSPFWHHAVKAGREAVYEKIRTSGGGRERIADNIDHAFLSDYAFRVVTNHDQRYILREFIENMLWNEWLGSF